MMTLSIEQLPKPVTFRLPLPHEVDPFFGLTRAHYYLGHKHGWWKLIQLAREGKQRGVTLVPFDQVAAYVRDKHSTPWKPGKPPTDGKGKKARRMR